MMRWRLASNIVLVVVMIALQACNVQEKHGAATPDRVVDRYLLALETKDFGQMEMLQSPDTVGTAAKLRIYRLGGHKLQQRQVKYIKTKPTLWLAKITATYVDRDNLRQKFEDTVAIAYEGKESWKLYSGRWYLLVEKDNTDLP
jgi:hypothetical protein